MTSLLYAAAARLSTARPRFCKKAAPLHVRSAIGSRPARQREQPDKAPRPPAFLSPLPPDRALRRPFSLAPARGKAGGGKIFRWERREKAEGRIGREGMTESLPGREEGVRKNFFGKSL